MIVVSFIHLHVYSAYSLLNSTASVEKLVLDAKRKGFTSIALTDRNVMYGAVSFYKQCLKHGMKPIIGLTVDVLSERQKGEAFPLVLLAKNQIGLQNLLKITSAVQTKSPVGIPVKWLKHYSQGLFAITPGIEGELEQAVMNEDEESIEQVLSLYLQLFGDSFYMSLQNHGQAEEMELSERFMRISAKNGVKLVATNRVYYLNQEDSFSHECLIAIKNGQKLQDVTHERLPSDQYYLKTPSEMAELFPQIPDALQNTLKIAEACNVTIELKKTKLPKFPTGNEMSADALLQQLCWQGLAQRYREQTEEIKERLQYELDIIKKMQFSDYFLIVWDFIKFARESGILTGPGRGSAAGSLVAYTLYITDVDPIRHNLLFERFLNPERISMPDIDLDFPDHRRDEVIHYVAEKYGQLHVAQIITFGTLAAKAALRDVGRVFGLSTKELDQLSRMIPQKPGINLRDAYQQSQGLRNFVNESSQNKRLFQTALKLEGLPRHTSTHAAGIVISEDPLVNIIPIQKGQDDLYLTQYSMEHLEELGLLKIDFLGLRNLTLIENILVSIHRTTGVKCNIKNIPMDDQETYGLISSGRTTGIFQLESEGMRNVLTKLKPTHFEDIVAVNALYRPGPMENIPHFINRKHGVEKVVYPHPRLQPILENTYGVIVYQEQIMQIASVMAGFSLGEADLLRRAVSKKQKEVLDRERAHFIAGAQKLGYESGLAHSIYDLIVKFADYGFNRSHAVAYSMISYQLAYLKTHYPTHFMASLLTSVSGNEDKIGRYIGEMKQMEIPIFPPSINKSGYSFYPEKTGIRYSLAGIKGVGMVALREIFRARKEKTFTDLFDFCIRVSQKAVNHKTLESLVCSGSFDEFGEDRAVLLASIDVALDHAALVKPMDGEEGSLFINDEFSIRPKYTEVEPMREEDKLRLEKEVLGFYLSNHPVSVYEQWFQLLNTVPLYDYIGGSTFKRSIVYISEVKKIRTKKGEQMAFLTISDQSGEMEVVVFPNVLKTKDSLLQKGKMILIQGKVEIRNSKSQLVMKSAENVDTALEGIKKTR